MQLTFKIWHFYVTYIYLQKFSKKSIRRKPEKKKYKIVRFTNDIFAAVALLSLSIVYIKFWSVCNSSNVGWVSYKHKQELRECIPPPIWKFLAPPNRKSMGQSGLLMLFYIQTMKWMKLETRDGSVFPVSRNRHKIRYWPWLNFSTGVSLILYFCMQNARETSKSTKKCDQYH